MKLNAQTVDVASIIDRSPWFVDLPPEAKQKLISACKITKYKKNSFLFSAGDVTKSIYCLIDGRIRVSITSSIGQEFAINDLEPESWLGEASLFSNEGRVLELQFKEDGHAISIPNSVILQVGDQYPIMYRSILQDGLKRTRSMYELLGGMLFYPLKSRLAGRILYLLQDHGKEKEDGIYLDINLSQKEFARMVFGSRQRINKIFRQWEDDGIVLMKENQYFIPDIERLQQEVELLDE